MIKYITLALTAIAALAGIDNSYSYGLLGAAIYGESNCSN
jgi:hypothetical protein